MQRHAAPASTICIWIGLPVPVYCLIPNLLFPAPHRGAKYTVMTVTVCVCVFVCPRAYLPNYTSDLCQFFVHVIYGRSSVLLWRRSDMSCTSGLWMTSDLCISQGSSTWPPSWWKHSPHEGKRTHTHGPTFRAPRSGPTWPQWACWIFNSWHHVCT